MINIWDFVGAKNIRITGVSGKTYQGDVVSVDACEEMYDAEEDEINVQTNDGTIFTLMPSEISKIERV